MIKSITKISIIIFLFICTTLLFAGGDKKHHVGVFAGATSNLYLEHTYFTLGVDYEYRLNHSFGVGFIGDYVMADHAETLLMGGIFYHPISSLKIYVANGVALTTEVRKDNISEDKEISESYSVFRIGTGYDFQVGDFSVTPTVAWDLINGHSSIVYGLTFGIGF